MTFHQLLSQVKTLENNGEKSNGKGKRETDVNDVQGVIVAMIIVIMVLIDIIVPYYS